MEWTSLISSLNSSEVVDSSVVVADPVDDVSPRRISCHTEERIQWLTVSRSAPDQSDNRVPDEGRIWFTESVSASRTSTRERSRSLRFQNRPSARPVTVSVERREPTRSVPDVNEPVSRFTCDNSDLWSSRSNNLVGIVRELERSWTPRTSVGLVTPRRRHRSERSWKFTSTRV